ncbi:MAG: serine/threonine-protein kinase [Kofleriaceae bacterium]
MARVGKTASAGVEPGQILLGKYRVDQILGQGGMGVVAQATHLALGERVAIKFLRSDMVADEPTLARFLREAQSAAKLKCEFVAHTTDVGLLESGAPYMVMEFLEGEDVAQAIKERGALHPSFAIDLVLQACVALAEAHSLGIVHRDIKPTNLFITWRPDGGAQLKVLDFGISKVVAGGEELSLTSTMSLLGTPAYMAPEQMRSARDVDSRSDIWSLGTVLFEMVEGQRPFYAETFTEMCVRVISDPPAPLTVELPPGLADVIHRCLEKEPSARYYSIGDLAAELAPLARDPMAAHELVKRIQGMLSRRDSIPRRWSSSAAGRSARARAQAGSATSGDPGGRRVRRSGHRHRSRRPRGDAGAVGAVAGRRRRRPAHHRAPPRRHGAEPRSRRRGALGHGSGAAARLDGGVAAAEAHAAVARPRWRRRGGGGRGARARWRRWRARRAAGRARRDDARRDRQRRRARRERQGPDRGGR